MKKNWLKLPKLDIYQIYKCYMGRDKWYRTIQIMCYVEGHNGKMFFDRFSLPNDSIHEFLLKAEGLGLFDKA